MTMINQSRLSLFISESGEKVKGRCKLQRVVGRWPVAISHSTHQPVASIPSQGSRAKLKEILLAKK